MTPEWVLDNSRSLQVLSAIINISGGVRGIKGFATLRSVINLQFVDEARAEVVRDVSRYLEISSSCLVYLRKREILFLACPGNGKLMFWRGIFAKRRIVGVWGLDILGFSGNWVKPEEEFKSDFVQIVFIRVKTFSSGKAFSCGWRAYLKKMVCLCYM